MGYLNEKVKRSFEVTLFGLVTSQLRSIIRL